MATSFEAFSVPIKFSTVSSLLTPNKKDSAEKTNDEIFSGGNILPKKLEMPYLIDINYLVFSKNQAVIPVFACKSMQTQLNLKLIGTH